VALCELPPMRCERYHSPPPLMSCVPVFLVEAVYDRLPEN
jgi:hypothetical protein